MVTGCMPVSAGHHVVDENFRSVVVIARSEVMMPSQGSRVDAQGGSYKKGGQTPGHWAFVLLHCSVLMQPQRTGAAE